MRGIRHGLAAVFTCCAVTAVFTCCAVTAPAAAEPPAGAQVTGFGGFFFRGQDTENLVAWYRDNLGIPPVPRSYEVQPWMQEAGPTVFAPFAADSASFGDKDKHFVLNFRTRDLDALVAHLRANGNEVEMDPEVYPNGRFAGTQDPEGNPIQLWEPADPSQNDRSGDGE